MNLNSLRYYLMTELDEIIETYSNTYYRPRKDSRQVKGEIKMIEKIEKKVTWSDDILSELSEELLDKDGDLLYNDPLTRDDNSLNENDRELFETIIQEEPIDYHIEDSFIESFEDNNISNEEPIEDPFAHIDDVLSIPVKNEKKTFFKYLQKMFSKHN